MAKKNFRKGNNNKGGKPQGVGRNQEDTIRSDAGRTEYKSSHNDASWYAANPQLLSDAASIAYNISVGAPYTVKRQGSSFTETEPGICVLHFHTLPGYSGDNSSPLNIAARNIYSYVRHANSGHANYDSPDLMIYLLAMDDLYSKYAFMTRAYGILNAYTQLNRYFAKHLFEASGLDFEDFQANIANFRYFINQTCVKINSLCVPNTMPYFKRHVWMNAGIYTDSPTAKCQLYLFVPDYTLRFNEFQGAGMLVADSFTRQIDMGGDDRKLTFAQLRDIISRNLAAVIESEDMNIMSGDILKAYGPGNIVSLSPIGESFVVLPEYNEEVLSQIQNATVQDLDRQAALGVTQDVPTGALLTKPTAMKRSVNCYTFNMEPVLTMRKDKVEPADTMVATRLVAFSDPVTMDPSTDPRLITACGSEIITRITFIEKDATGDTVTTMGYDGVYLFDVTGNQPAAAEEVARSCCRISRFDWHPCVHLFSEDGTTEQDHQVSWIGDLQDRDNIAVLGYTTAQKMHETALLSLFNVPMNIR